MKMRITLIHWQSSVHSAQRSAAIDIPVFQQFVTPNGRQTMQLSSTLSAQYSLYVTARTMESHT